MRLPSLRVITLFVAIACVMLPNAMASQRKPTERDKSQIIKFILRTYDFTEKRQDTPAHTILLLNENISPADIPSRRDVKFRIVQQHEIDRLRQTGGVEYYEFRPFEITKSGVLIVFVRTSVSLNGGNGSAMEYTCRKLRGRWKLRARLDGVWAT